MLTPTGAVTSGVWVMIVADRRGRVGDEAHVAVGDDADQLAVAVDDRHAGDAVARRTARRPRAACRPGWQVTGLVIMPDSERLTRSTWSAWSSMERLRCSTPMPPWRAMAIAIRASVTVSIALESSGMGSSMLRVSRVRVSTRLGTTSDSPGWSSTSSKVRPSGTTRAEPAGSSGRWPPRSACSTPAGRSVLGEFSTIAPLSCSDGLQRGGAGGHRSAPRCRHVASSYPVSWATRPRQAGPARGRGGRPRRVGSTVRGCTTSPSTRSTATRPTRPRVWTTRATTRRRSADRRRAAGRAGGPRRPGDLPGAAGPDRGPRAGHRVRGLPRAALLRLGPAPGQPAAPARLGPAPGARAGLRPGPGPLRDLGIRPRLRRRGARHPAEGTDDEPS